MNCGWSLSRCFLVLLVLATQPQLAAAQAYVGFGGPFSPFDIAGDWDTVGTPVVGGGGGGMHEDAVDRGAGPDSGDYAGYPLNEAGRYKARGHSPSLLTVPEHQCRLHGVAWSPRGPRGLTIVKVFDPVTEKLVAYRMTGLYSWPRTIWMDGRPHPGPNARHTFEGFSTGRWLDDKLVVETTHIKAGYARRNGVPNSDQARITEHFIRTDGYLSINSALVDPIYYGEPLVRSSDFKVAIRPSSETITAFGAGRKDGGVGETFYKCAAVDELDVPEGTVPSYLPGREPDDLETFARKHDLPLEAAFGGPETQYPQYAQRLAQMGSYKPGRVAAVFAANPEPVTTQPPADARVAATEVSSQHVKGKVWSITAGGLNTVVQVGDEGILVVDPGRQELAPAVLAEIRKIGGNRPIRQIIYTSSDIDRVTGTSVINKALTPGGQTANIMAHERVALRMARARLPGETIPADTFYRGKREISFNDEPIEVIHVPAAHSDGDIAVFFRESDVVVAGALLPNVTYPEIQIDNGGSMQGMVDALNRILSMTIATFNGQDGTMVIPGRGRIYDEGDVAEYRNMLTIIRDRFADAIAGGKTLEEVRAARLTRDYDGRYGVIPGPGSSAAFTETAYLSLKDQPAAATAQAN